MSRRMTQLFDWAHRSAWAIRPQAMDALLEVGRSLLSGPNAPAAESSFPLWLLPDHEPEPLYTLSGSVAVIPVEGTLGKKLGFLESGTSYRRIREGVEAALSDPQVKAILLDIDSPGGSVDGIDSIHAYLVQAGQKKPLYAYTDGCMCSAAYWLASAARHIAAAPTSDVGSIGVFLLHLDWSVNDALNGLKCTYIHAGSHKVLGNNTEPLGDKARSYLQHNIDGVYAVFLARVVEGRGLLAEAAQVWADGKIFGASEALSVGLIDRLATRDIYLAHINAEVLTTMDMKELQTDHPDLYASILSQVRSEAKSSAETTQAEACAAAVKNVLDIAAVVLSPDSAQRLSAVVGQGFSVAQLAALSTAGLLNAKQDVDEGQKTSRQDVLKALQAATPGGVHPAHTTAQSASPTAIADRVAGYANARR